MLRVVHIVIVDACGSHLRPLAWADCRGMPESLACRTPLNLLLLRLLSLLVRLICRACTLSSPEVPLSVTEIPGSETGTILGKLSITSWASSAVDLTLSYFAFSNSPQELPAFPLEVARDPTPVTSFPTTTQRAPHTR